MTWKNELFYIFYLVCWFVIAPIAFFVLPYFIDKTVCTWIGTFGILTPLIIIFGSIILSVVQQRIEKKKEAKEKAKTWELEDQTKELKEQLATGAITQEDYEQEKKKLLGKSKT